MNELINREPPRRCHSLWLDSDFQGAKPSHNPATYDRDVLGSQGFLRKCELPVSLPIASARGQLRLPLLLHCWL